ncbi:MAG: sugar ABC transporter substrate-binding protein [Candidatus Hadarchaeota archaeon]
MKFSGGKGISQKMTVGLVVVVIILIAAGAGAYYYIQDGDGDTDEWEDYPDPNAVDLDEETPTIGGVFLGLSNPWGELNRDAFEWYVGDVLGWDYEVVWPDDVEDQNDGAEMLIDQGVDALVVDPIDREANAKIGQVAKEAGIPVVLFGNDMQHSWPLAMFQRNDRLSGEACGEYLAQALEEKKGEVSGKILIIHGRRGTNSQSLRAGGFFDAIDEYRENLEFVEVGNSWSATAELPEVRSALQANPDIDAVYEMMGGFHTTFKEAAEELGWSEEEIKDVINVNVDCFPVNVDAFEEGTQDYARMMPTGGYMMAPSLELLREYWKAESREEVEEVLPEIGTTYSIDKYAPEMQVNAEANGFQPLQWFEDEEYGVSPTDIRPAPAAGEDTPWVLIRDRIVDETNYEEDFIYWNWPVWGLSD